MRREWVKREGRGQTNGQAAKQRVARGQGKQKCRNKPKKKIIFFPYFSSLKAEEKYSQLVCCRHKLSFHGWKLVLS